MSTKSTSSWLVAVVAVAIMAVAAAAVAKFGTTKILQSLREI
jgi:hypothetical protein